MIYLNIHIDSFEIFNFGNYKVNRTISPHETMLFV